MTSNKYDFNFLLLFLKKILSVPKLDLIGHLRLDEEQPNSHAVKNVETDEEISWGTPLTTSRTPRGTPKQLISSLRERTPKIETSEKNRNQKEKYFYLNESARPLHDKTSNNFSFEIFSVHLISLMS